LAFAVVMCLSQLANMGNPAHPSSWSAMSSGAVVLLAGILVATYAFGRLVLLEPVLTPAAVLIAGSGLVDSVATFGLCIAVTVAQSLYGSMKAWALRSVLLGMAFMAAVAVSPYSIGGRWISWHDPALIAMVPQLAMLSVLVRGFYRSLLRQYQASERDATLAVTGSQLIGVTDLERVRLLGGQASARLSQLSPDTVTVVLERGPDGITVVHGVGLPDDVIGTVLPADSVAGLNAADSGTVHTLTGGLQPLQQHTPGITHWRGVGLAATGADRYLMVGGAKRVSDDVVNAFRNLGHQIAFAEANCRAHQSLDYQANHDHLTTLPNRAQFFRRLTAAIDEEVAATLLVIDLDDFKQVNDVHGHGAGDELLVEVAARLAEVGGPNGVAARFGGDEFALLLPNPSADTDALAERLCQRLLEPMRLDAATVTVGASIGVATATAGLTAGDLMRCADIAMYSAKAKGKNRVERFSNAVHGDIAHHRLLEEHLTHALQRGEIVLHYQPYLDPRTVECVGVQALPRWEHPVLGQLSPEDFMPLAVRTGQIAALGTHIIRTACSQMAAWRALPGGAELRLSVNVAIPQLLDPNFTADVRAALAETGLAADRLYLQVSESEQLFDNAVRQQLDELAGAGVRIALDDFGAGDASLTIVRSLPIHQLKIGPRMLHQRDDRLTADDLLRLVASMGSVLGIDTIADGVETPQQADRLRDANITHAQGTLFAGPMPAPDLLDWLAKNRQQTATAVSSH
jgi:diguanylate cyclase (GGDEF)-like protein